MIVKNIPSATRLMKTVTLNVTLHGMTELKIRCWIGIKLIKLAASIMGMGVKVNNELSNKKS